MYITENGVALADASDEYGLVNDTLRIEYIESHLDAISKAIEAGADVRGYYVWSLYG